MDTFACLSDGTSMAQIDWQCLHTAWREGQLPVSAGEWRILKIAASLAAGTGVSLRDTLPGLDNHNLRLVVTAIRHATASHPRAANDPPRQTLAEGPAGHNQRGPLAFAHRSSTAHIRPAKVSHRATGSAVSLIGRAAELTRPSKWWRRRNGPALWCAAR